jgi:molybdenum cofactor sulfurtransferase
MNVYPRPIEEIRSQEYPYLEGELFRSRNLARLTPPGRTYLDHAGTQLPPKSLVDRFAADLATNLYGNPHSESAPAALSGARVAAVRARTLAFFGADPDEYDLVFVANATAAIKLVADGFRDYCATAAAEDEAAAAAGRAGRALAARFNWLPRGRRRRRKGKRAREFHFLYHRDAHTSVVGARELSTRHRCLGSDADVARWIRGLPAGADGAPAGAVSLFAYPGQSNMTGRRLPLSWSADVHRAGAGAVYTLLDAAALATTKPLRVSQWEPDFVAVSFYKIFGFPDLGALLVRRPPPSPAAPPPGRILTARRYFGGGTVDMVAALDASWHVRKRGALHDALEEGTVPFHSVVALGHALDAMERVYGGLGNVGRHTARLTAELHAELAGLRHACGAPVVRVHNEPGARFGDPDVQGATVAFSVLGAPPPSSSSSSSEFEGGEQRGPRREQPAFGYGQVERLADARRIHVRSGSLCNPGGFAAYLDWTADDLAAALRAGHSCSSPRELALGRPTGVVRVSLGACSSRADVLRLVGFLRSEFADRRAEADGAAAPRAAGEAEGGPPAPEPRAPVVAASPARGALVRAGPSTPWGDAYADADGRGGCCDGGAAAAAAKTPKKMTFIKSAVERRTTVAEI